MSSKLDPYEQDMINAVLRRMTLEDLADRTPTRSEDLLPCSQPPSLWGRIRSWVPEDHLHTWKIKPDGSLYRYYRVAVGTASFARTESYIPQRQRRSGWIEAIAEIDEACAIYGLDRYGRQIR